MAFLADTSADAYERVIDRLLASPHYGEHFARDWLDVVRFAEAELEGGEEGEEGGGDCSDVQEKGEGGIRGSGRGGLWADIPS